MLTFTVNYFPSPWPTSHVWSLSVEEQFYLLWPVAFVFMISRGAPFLWLLAALALPIVGAPIARVISHQHLGGPAFYSYSFLTRCDSLAWGCLLAVLCAYRANAVEALLARWRVPIAAAAFGVIVAMIVMTRLFVAGFLTVPLSTTFSSAGVAALLLLTIDRPAAFGCQWLNSPAVRQVGLWSYSIYLWQQLFCAHPSDYGLISPPWFLSFPFWLIPAVVCGCMSYYVVERPFLRLRDRKSRQRHPTPADES